MRRFLVTLLVVVFCFSLVGCGSSKSFSMIGKWEMSNYSDSIDGVKFDESLSDDEKAYMVFEEDSSFYTMELGMLDANGSWKLLENKFLVFDFNGNELTLDITVESADMILVENSGEYQRWKRVD